MWAPAGQVVTVTISPAVAAQMTASGGTLGVQIGSHTDGIAHKTSWCRLPYGMVQRRTFTSAAGGNVVTVTSGMGGLMYITVQWVRAVLGMIQAVAFTAERGTYAAGVCWSAHRHVCWNHL
jgi:hypothetical protein